MLIHIWAAPRLAMMEAETTGRSAGDKTGRAKPFHLDLIIYGCFIMQKKILKALVKKTGEL